MNMHIVGDASRHSPGRGRRLAAAVALCAAGLSLGSAAQAESMEERLRAQLRSTTQQLQQLQSEQAQINAAIKTIRSNGTYNTIAKKYFDFDPYGN